MKNENNRIVIAGGGLVGSLLATYLGRAGHTVDVYESRADPRKTNIHEGRSFNLVLSQRGLEALKKAGIKEEIVRITTRMPGRIIHTVDGSEHYQPYGAGDKDCLHAISRTSLNKALLDIAEKSGNVRVNFGHRCLDYEIDRKSLKTKKDGEIIEVETERVFGTDGSSSAIRDRLSYLTQTQPSKDVAEYGYKELRIPAITPGKHSMEPNAFHVWPRGKYVMTAQANIDGSFAGALFLPTEGDISFATIGTTQIGQFFENNFPDLVPKMPSLVEDYGKNPVGSLCTIRCPKWHFKDRIVLLGDAAHAIVPFYGQGVNCGFEDVVALNQAMRDNCPNWENAFSSFEEQRKNNAYAIADLSLQNMREMSEGITNPKVLLAKEIAHRLAVKFPKDVIATHALVASHPEYSYVEAKARGDALDKITLGIAERITEIGEADLISAHQKIIEAYGSLKELVNTVRLSSSSI